MIAEKCFLLHLKSSFRSRDFLCCHLPIFFSLVSHCFRAWSKINLKVCDVINCLNKNLIIHLVWYLEKEKRYDSETLSIDRVLKKEHLYGKNSCWKCAPKASTRSLFYFGKQPKTATHSIQEILLTIRYFERGLSKTF